MTTGEKIVDLRVPFSGSCGNGVSGFYYRKTWLGSDYPSRAVKKNIWVPPRTLSYLAPIEENPSSGTLSVTNRRYVKFLTEGHYRTVWVKSPKRATIEHHPYTTDWQEYNDLPLQWGFNFDGQANRPGTISTCFSLLSTPDPWTSNDDIALLGQLRTATAGSDFHAGNFLGEGSQCLRMIGDTATRVAKSLKYIRRGRVSQAVRVLFGSRRSQKEILEARAHFYRTHKVPYYAQAKDRRLKVGEVLSDLEISNLWLSVQYGWLPLLEDAHAAAGMLSHLLNDPLQFRVRVSRNAGGMKMQIPRVGLYRPVVHTVRSSTSILAILSEKDVAQLTGLTDPLSIAWEVCPYSFVVDWFIPVGNWLQARGTASALTGTFVTSHIFAEEQRKLVPEFRWTNGYYVNSPQFYYKHGVLTRTVSSTLSVPHPTVKPLGKALSWLHCSNAVALLSQVVAPGRRS